MYVSACIYALGFRAKGGRTTEMEINESWRNGKGMEIGLGRKAKGERRKAKGEMRKTKGGRRNARRGTKVETNECDNDDRLGRETKGDTCKRNRTLNEEEWKRRKVEVDG